VGELRLGSIWTCPRNHHSFVVVDPTTIETELQTGHFPRPHCNRCGQKYELSQEDRERLQEWVADEMKPPVCAVCGCSIDQDGAWLPITPSCDEEGVIQVRYESLCGKHLA
jgi:hypothetical protein